MNATVHVGRDRQMPRIGFPWMLGLAGVFFAIAYQWLPFNESDAAVVVDLGRITYGGPHDQIPQLVGSTHRPLFTTSILGVGLLDVVLASVSYPRIGVRIMAVVWLLVLAASTRHWIRMQSDSAWVRWAIPAMILVDPLAHASARHGRLDNLAIALVLISSSLLIVHFKPGRGRWSAGMSGLAFFASVSVWPTAACLLPFVIASGLPIEALRSARLRVLRTLAEFGIGAAIGLVTSFLLLIVFRPEGIEDALRFAKFESRRGMHLGALWFVAETWVRYSPMLCLIAAVGMFPVGRSWSLVAALAITVGVMLGTNIHDMRAYYLMPYVIAFTLFGLSNASARMTSMALPAAAIGYGAVVTIAVFGLQSARNFLSGATGNRSAIVDAINSEHCRDVLDYGNEFYFEAVANGWKSRSALVIDDHRSPPDWLYEEHATQQSFIDALIAHDAPCAIVIRRRNDWLVSGRWPDATGVDQIDGFVERDVRQDDAERTSTLADRLFAPGFVFGGGNFDGPYRLFVRVDPPEAGTLLDEPDAAAAAAIGTHR